MPFADYMSLAASTTHGQKLQARGLFDLFFDKWPLGMDMQRVAATEVRGPAAP